MMENDNLMEPPSYGETPYPDNSSMWLDKPTTSYVVGVEESDETSTLPSGMIPTGTGGK